MREKFAKMNPLSNIHDVLSNKIIIPETWDSLEEFAHWFKENNFPMRVPANMQVYITDHSYSCVVFRQNVYQAELYMIAPNSLGTPHSHDFENLPIHMGGHIFGKSQASPIGGHVCKNDVHIIQNTPHPESMKIGRKVGIGQWHNIDTYNQGHLMYVIQRWAHEDEMTSAVIRYNGEPMGPIHAKIILKQ